MSLKHLLIGVAVIVSVGILYGVFYGTRQGNVVLSDECKKPRYCTVSIVTTKTYLMPVLTMINTYKRVGSKHPFILLTLKEVYDVIPQWVIDSKVLFDEIRIFEPLLSIEGIESRSHRRLNWSKLRIWEILTDFDQCAWIDADTVVLNNFDHVFGMPVPTGCFEWTNERRDAMNTGFFLFNPSVEYFELLKKTLISPEHVTLWKGEEKDQDLTDQIFFERYLLNKWHILPLYFMVDSRAAEPINETRIMHYPGIVKPWNLPLASVLREFSWWYTAFKQFMNDFPELANILPKAGGFDKAYEKYDDDMSLILKKHRAEKKKEK